MRRTCTHWLHDTAAIDRDTKPAEYRRVPGMTRYLLVEQTRRAVTVLQRRNDAWIEAPVAGGSIALPELGVALPIADVYLAVRTAG